MWMRGGTSKGGYFLAEDLPADTAARDAFLNEMRDRASGGRLIGISFFSKLAMFRHARDAPRARYGVAFDKLKERCENAPFRRKVFRRKLRAFHNKRAREILSESARQRRAALEKLPKALRIQRDHIGLFFGCQRQKLRLRILPAHHGLSKTEE